MQVAPNGRVFFIDHCNKATSWVDPRTGCASPMPNTATTLDRHEDELGPLPEGWEERVHSDGRIFFIDHNTRIVSYCKLIKKFTIINSICFLDTMGRSKIIKSDNCRTSCAIFA
jgi:hypothetical protein